jgi:GNAT superfamily N-acetyltransferase
MPTPQVRRATHEDREVSLRTIVRAFEADPLLRFFFPEEPSYAVGAPAFFGFLLDIRLDGGEVLLADDGLAVALWTPPGGLELSDEDIDRRWADEVSPRLHDGEEARIDRFERAHERIAPEGPHRYLGVLATDPDHRGRGLARAVLDPVIARDDADGMPSHLETCTPANLPFYARFGFDVHAETTIEDGPRLWELVRSPRVTVG